MTRRLQLLVQLNTALPADHFRYKNMSVVYKLTLLKPYPATTVKSLKLFFFEKNVAPYERPLVLNGHFRLAVVVAAQKMSHFTLDLVHKTRVNSHFLCEFYNNVL